jgi:hypothetical protein
MEGPTLRRENFKDSSIPIDDVGGADVLLIRAPVFKGRLRRSADGVVQDDEIFGVFLWEVRICGEAKSG